MYVPVSMVLVGYMHIRYYYLAIWLSLYSLEGYLLSTVWEFWCLFVLLGCCKNRKKPITQWKKPTWKGVMTYDRHQIKKSGFLSFLGHNTLLRGVLVRAGMNLKELRVRHSHLYLYQEVHTSVHLEQNERPKKQSYYFRTTLQRRKQANFWESLQQLQDTRTEDIKNRNNISSTYVSSFSSQRCIENFCFVRKKGCEKKKSSRIVDRRPYHKLYNRCFVTIVSCTSIKLYISCYLQRK